MHVVSCLFELNSKHNCMTLAVNLSLGRMVWFEVHVSCVFQVQSEFSKSGELGVTVDIDIKLVEIWETNPVSKNTHTQAVSALQAINN